MDFKSLGLNTKIEDILNNFGYDTPTEVQQKAIPELLKNRDMICRSETGSGKTFAFALPILQQIDVNSEKIQALIVCPTRELAIQVCEEAKKIATELNIKLCAVFGGSAISRQIDSLKKKPHIVVGTTGRIMDLIDKRALKIEDADYIVLDEADEMLDMGFLPDIEKIFSHTKQQKTVMMFSATMPNGVKNLAKQYQQNPLIVEVGTANKALDNIKQNYIFVDKRTKKEALKELFFSDVYGKTIVFTNTKQFADEIAHFLMKNAIKCKSIHSDLRQNERKRVLESFRQGKIDVLVATDVASRGLDIKDVKWVVNFDLPHELEFYVHRIGRTARAGESGSVINIITTLEQLSSMRDIEKLTNAKIEKFDTKSANLSQYFIDTKKLAQKNNRFASKSKNFDTKSQNKRKFGRFSDNFEFLIDENNRKIKKKKNKVEKTQKTSNSKNRKENHKDKYSNMDNKNQQNNRFKQQNKVERKFESKSKSKQIDKKARRDKISKHTEKKWYDKFKK